MNEQIGVTYFPVLVGAGYHMAVFYANRESETRHLTGLPASRSAASRPRAWFASERKSQSAGAGFAEMRCLSESS
jgi:hypothetical protein